MLWFIGEIKTVLSPIDLRNR